MDFDKCTICKSENFIDFTVCQCGKMFLCETCSTCYADSCLDSNIPMCCFYCSSEMLENNMTEKCANSYFGRLTEMAKRSTSIYYCSGNSKLCNKAVGNMNFNFNKLVKKNIPKGILVALKVLHGTTYTKLAEEKNEKYNKRIAKLVEKTKHRCSCYFCDHSETTEKAKSKSTKAYTDSGYKCSECSIITCSSCGFECFPGHDSVCSSKRKEKTLIGIVTCQSCDHIQEKFYSFPKTKCGNCNETITCADAKEYNAFDDLDGKTANLLRDYKEKISVGKYQSKHIFESFTEYSDFKKKIIEANNYAKLNLSIKIKIDLEERISYKFIKNALMDIEYPDVQKLTSYLTEIEEEKLKQISEYLEQNKKYLMKKKRREEREEQERLQEEAEKEEKRKRKEEKKKKKNNKVVLNPDYADSDDEDLVRKDLEEEDD